MQAIEKLIKDHAYWSDRVRHLKKMGCQAAAECDHRNGTKGHPITENLSCIEFVYSEWKQSECTEYGQYQNSFEEDWENTVCEGGVCEACRNVRRFKEQRIAARKRLGAIRSAITRVGRRLSLEEKP